MVEPFYLEALRPVVKALEQLGVAYHVGGSVASSAHGIARTTLDVDMVAELSMDHVKPLVEELQAAYYIDAEMIMDAIRRRASFNLLHLPTATKIDVFIPKHEPYDRIEFQRAGRARLDALSNDQEADLFYLASPEDVILRKLQWYRAGGEVSERQWGDVLGVLKVQAKSLDREYMKEWADTLGLSDLLERATDHAGLE